LLAVRSLRLGVKCNLRAASMSPRPHPHVAIPPGAAPPSRPSPRHVDGLELLVTPPASDDPLNLWSDEHRNSTFTPSSPNTGRLRLAFPEPEISRPHSRASSVYETGSPRSYGFPEPQIYMSPMTRTSSLRPSVSHQNLGHRSTRSESTLTTRPSLNRGESRPPSFMSTESSPEVWHPLFHS
jgi:RHO1 GDP-GTP exchange protein 1/2